MECEWLRPVSAEYLVHRKRCICVPVSDGRVTAGQRETRLELIAMPPAGVSSKTDS